MKRLLALILFSMTLCLKSPAASPDESNPALVITKDYVRAVIARDWEKCATMLLPKALERKLMETVSFIKESQTMELEAARLAVYKVHKVEELEKLTPQEFYVRERNAVQSGVKGSDGAKELSTLKMEILASGSEENGAFMHVTIRTHRETTEMRIHELALVSLLQDPADKNKWYVVPDTQLPVVEPLGGAEDGSSGK